MVLAPRSSRDPSDLPHLAPRSLRDELTFCKDPPPPVSAVHLSCVSAESSPSSGIDRLGAEPPPSRPAAAGGPRSQPWLLQRREQLGSCSPPPSVIKASLQPPLGSGVLESPAQLAL